MLKTRPPRVEDSRELKTEREKLAQLRVRHAELKDQLEQIDAEIRMHPGDEGRIQEAARALIDGKDYDRPELAELKRRRAVAKEALQIVAAAVEEQRALRVKYAEEDAERAACAAFDPELKTYAQRVAAAVATLRKELLLAKAAQANAAEMAREAGASPRFLSEIPTLLKSDDLAWALERWGVLLAAFPGRPKD